MKKFLYGLVASLLHSSVQSFGIPHYVQDRAVAAAASANSWAGSSLYFVHALSESDQNDYINTLAGFGAKVLRIWVTASSAGCQKGSTLASNVPNFEDTIGTYNYDVLKALDGVLAKLAAKGMKAIISPHDGNALNTADSRCDAYCKKYNSADSFYISDGAKSEIDARYAAILSYKSPSSGKAWSQWSEAILAFDIENEPMIAARDIASQNDAPDWLCGRASNMQKIINSSGVLIATGGIGGDANAGFNFIGKALQCDAIDIMSIHSYVSTADFWTSNLPTFLSNVKTHSKLLMVEEFGFCDDATQPCGSVYRDNFDKQAAAITAQQVPFTYWQMVPGPDDSQAKTDCWTGCCQFYDGFEVGIHNQTGKGNVATAIKAAAAQRAAQSWPV
ncbi:MAG: hypothetical protein Q9160_002438 [Pyrenula sp. 1 TL-2023]